MVWNKYRPRQYLLLTLALTLILAVQITSNPATGESSTGTTTISLTPCADAYTVSSTPGTNHGSDTTLIVGRGILWQTTYTEYTLIRFDVSDIPANAQIISAELQLYQHTISGNGPYNVEMYSLQDAWEEDSVTFANQPQPDALLSTKSLPQTPALVTWDVTNIVRHWVAGTYPNWGLMLIPEENRLFSAQFYSREATDHPPRLIIQYVGPTPTPTPTPTSTPTVTPSPTPTVTPTPTAYPDLNVTGIWLQQGQICYQIWNRGWAPAYAPHTSALVIDGQVVAQDTIGNQSIQARERLNRCFPQYTWQCSGASDTVRVCADVDDRVPESDEQNNCHQVQWPCDQQAPQFVEGPRVSDITDHSAQVCWETDEPSRGIVFYDDTAETFTHQVQDTSLLTRHCVTLKPLSAATVYHYYVEVEDTASNTRRSESATFETASLPDTSSPTAAFTLPGTLSGRIPWDVDAVDDIGVDRVVFMVDGRPVHTDYTPPFNWYVDTRDLSEGPHTFSVRAVDKAGNVRSVVATGTVRNQFPEELSPVHVRILSPAAGTEVETGNVAVSVEVTHDQGWPVRTLTYKVDNHTVATHGLPCRGSVFVGGARREICDGEPPFRDTYMLDTSSLPEGAHAIEVIAEDEYGNTGRATVEIQVVHGARLTVTRSVERYGNYFEISLTLTNRGDRAAESVRIMDMHIALVPVEKAYVNGVPITCAVYRGYYRGDFLMECTVDSIPPHESRTLRYKGVVALLSGGITDAHTIGAHLLIQYEDQDLTYDELSVQNLRDMRAAVAAADYLIVTQPEALEHHMWHARVLYTSEGHYSRTELGPVPSSREFGHLYSLMAELAIQKQGVLGFLSTRPYYLASLLTPTGAWGRLFMRGAPSHYGLKYMLIVGDNNVVPSFNYPTSKYPKDTGGRIRNTDYPYGDVDEDLNTLELAVGRIVGEHYEFVVRALESALADTSYQRRAALLNSGPEGWWEMFAREVRLVRNILQSHGMPRGNITVIDNEAYTTPANLLSNALTILGTWACEIADCTRSTTATGDEILTGCRQTPLEDRITYLQERYSWNNWTKVRAAVCQYDDDPKTVEIPPPPEDYAELIQKIDIEDAKNVEHARRNWAREHDCDAGGACVEEIHIPYRLFPSPESASRALLNDVEDALDGQKDVMYVNKHGAPGAWYTFMERRFDQGAEPSHPLVWVNACLTGKYDSEEPWAFSAQNVSAPESAARAGASAYVGAVEVAPAVTSDEMAHEFFDTWAGSRDPVGEVLRRLREDRWTQGGLQKYAALIFNLFGDPKAGMEWGTASTRQMSAPRPRAQTAPPTTLNVDIPDYYVRTVNGEDWVTIPGGRFLYTDAGRPIVPYKSITITVPSGYQVQDVTLVSKSDLEERTGLHVPIYRDIVDPYPPEYMEPVAGWFPLVDYTWTTVAHREEGRTLLLNVYPFHYDPATARSRFYRHFVFRITYVQTPATIVDARLNRTMYHQNDHTARLDVWIQQISQTPQHARLSVVIREVATETVKHSFPTRALHEWQGLGSVSYTWDPTTLGVGMYALNIRLVDAQDRLWAEKVVYFEVKDTRRYEMHFPVLKK